MDSLLTHGLMAAESFDFGRSARGLALLSFVRGAICLGSVSGPR